MDEKSKNKRLFTFTLYAMLGSLLFLVIFEDITFKLFHIFVIVLYFAFLIALLNVFNKKIEEAEKNIYNKKLREIEKKYKYQNIEEWTNQKTKEIAQLKANEEFRKEFIGNVAHELKTPIFNIQGFISTLLDGAIDNPDVNIKYLERTDKNAQRLIAIVKDLDTISKLETGKLLATKSTFNFVEVVMEIFELLDVQSKEFGIKLVFTPPSKPIFVYADKEKITEVIQNLVLNSIIYGRKDGTTEVILHKKKKKLEVIVRDNGIGIAKKDQDHIFERFFRVDKSRSRERGGSGLGLSIVKHILDAHNQIITVESELNKKTVFKFSLELADEHNKTS